MKNLFVLSFALMLSANLFAQSNKEDVEMVQALFGKEKKELVTQYMTIPDTQKAKFWALYDEYETTRKKFGKERMSLLGAYANGYASLDDKKATALMVDKMAWLEKYNKFHQSYFKKFSDVVGGLQASKLMQLEDYIENMVRITIQTEIPFIDELDKTVVPKK